MLIFSCSKFFLTLCLVTILDYKGKVYEMVVINSIYFTDACPCIKYIDRPDQGTYSDVRTNRVPKVANDTGTCYFCNVLIHPFNDFDTIHKFHVLWSTRYSYTDCTRFSPVTASKQVMTFRKRRNHARKGLHNDVLLPMRSRLWWRATYRYSVVQGGGSVETGRRATGWQKGVRPDTRVLPPWRVIVKTALHTRG